MVITVRLIKPLKGMVISYEADVIERSEHFMLVHACWVRDAYDTGYVVFSPGDHLYEHFYTDRWYNVYSLHTPDGELKGWYCNITRPAVFTEQTIESEDLELDVFVSPDRQKILVLDQDEFAARQLDTTDPLAYRAALAAVEEVQTLARAGSYPFQRSLTWLR